MKNLVFYAVILISLLIVAFLGFYPFDQDIAIEPVTTKQIVKKIEKTQDVNVLNVDVPEHFQSEKINIPDVSELKKEPRVLHTPPLATLPPPKVLDDNVSGLTPGDNISANDPIDQPSIESVNGYDEDLAASILADEPLSLKPDNEVESIEAPKVLDQEIEHKDSLESLLDATSKQHPNLNNNQFSEKMTAQDLDYFLDDANKNALSPPGSEKDYSTMEYDPSFLENKAK